MLLLFAYLIRGRGQVSLIAGYDDSAAVPPDVAGRLVGNTLLRIGATTVALGVLDAVADLTSVVWLGYTALVVFDAGLLVYRLNSYEDDASST
jgi:hypothetical protein